MRRTSQGDDNPAAPQLDFLHVLLDSARRAYFLEFLRARERGPTLMFWLDVQHFEESCAGRPLAIAQQAHELYRKYLALSARLPLRGRAAIAHRVPIDTIERYIADCDERAGSPRSGAAASTRKLARAASNSSIGSVGSAESDGGGGEGGRRRMRMDSAASDGSTATVAAPHIQADDARVACMLDVFSVIAAALFVEMRTVLFPLFLASPTYGAMVEAQTSDGATRKDAITVQQVLRSPVSYRYLHCYVETQLPAFVPNLDFFVEVSSSEESGSFHILAERLLIAISQFTTTSLACRRQLAAAEKAAAAYGAAPPSIGRATSTLATPAALTGKLRRLERATSAPAKFGGGSAASSPRSSPRAAQRSAQRGGALVTSGLAKAYRQQLARVNTVYVELQRRARYVARRYFGAVRETNAFGVSTKIQRACAAAVETFSAGLDADGNPLPRRRRGSGATAPTTTPRR